MLAEAVHARRSVMPIEQPLNLSAHCLDAWREMGFDTHPVFGRIVAPLAKALRDAPKYLMPAGGRLLDDERSLARMLPSMRLPFPCVALEYRSTGVIADWEATSSKRIALAWDLRHGSPLALKEMTGFTCASRPSILVQSIPYIDEQRAWMPVMGMVEICLDEPAEVRALDELDPGLAGLVGHRLNKSRTQSYAAIAHCTMPDLMDSYGDPGSLIAADSSDEVMAVMAFAAVVACSNVRSEVVAAPAALNKKRLANGRSPFFDTRVLSLGAEAARRPGGRAGATHASPATHLRQGHPRTLESGRVVWVNSAIVNLRRDVATPVPSYRVERPRGG